MGAERGQAQIEALAGIVALVAVAALAAAAFAAVQLILVADAATHAGALSQSMRGEPLRATRRALPRSLRHSAQLRERKGRISVRLPLDFAGGVAIGSEAWSRRPQG